jgi:hypothetical protein
MATTTVFTAVGDTKAAALFAALSGVYIGWGTGAGTASTSDTALFTEADTRQAVSNSSSGAVWQTTATMTAGSGETITNAGVLSALTSGSLYVHSSFTGVVLNTNDTIAFTFQVTFA